MPITPQEQAELDHLQDPRIEYLSSSFGGVFSMMANSLEKRKARLIELRIKKRLGDMKLDPSQDFKEYYRIQREEEESVERLFSSRDSLDTDSPPSPMTTK